jgi:hypothetical protein
MFAATVCTLLACPEIRIQLYIDTEVRLFLYDIHTMRDMDERLRLYQRMSGGDRRRVVHRMAAYLAARDRVRTTNLDDSIILYRVRRGDMPMRAQGGVVAQDLFIVGGRAAWAIAEITGLSIPELNEGLSPQEYQARVDKIIEILKCYK